MYSVVWDCLDAVYGCTEVMDQTYLDDPLQIPPLKSQDAASLKTFTNRLHGAVSLNPSTSKSVRVDEKKPVKRPNASHTSTIGHVSTEEGSKVTTS
ncbi:hypothetical protein OUZ56_029815 [Daphnia magna]|uniref:Uncharacterized protein n=1 Tax=Daphnia magna TaxID=35525 RepID=A0ABR0B7X7_9CRUS|nr:hypothetical protein OUZ56_029815 [Daphnia magna]